MLEEKKKKKHHAVYHKTGGHNYSGYPYFYGNSGTIGRDSDDHDSDDSSSGASDSDSGSTVVEEAKNLLEKLTKSKIKLKTIKQ
jgi:hypothetical protein